MLGFDSREASDIRGSLETNEECGIQTVPRRENSCFGESICLNSMTSFDIFDGFMTHHIHVFQVVISLWIVAEWQSRWMTPFRYESESNDRFKQTDSAIRNSFLRKSKRTVEKEMHSRAVHSHAFRGEMEICGEK
jgi:UDP-2,3-diacylglucosamine pyrophosphatase LpxH